MSLNARVALGAILVAAAVYLTAGHHAPPGAISEPTAAPTIELAPEPSPTPTARATSAPIMRPRSLAPAPTVDPACAGVDDEEGCELDPERYFTEN